MLYAGDACIVSRSPQGLAKMMEVTVEACRAFALTVSADPRKLDVHIKLYLRELYDQPKVTFPLKTRIIVEVEATEALLYGCRTWTFR